MTEINRRTNEAIRALNKTRAGTVAAPRLVYFVMETVTDEDGNYFALIAVEGETGYHKTDWKWGKYLRQAQEIADAKNEAMGIDHKDAVKIVLGTMNLKG